MGQVFTTQLGATSATPSGPAGGDLSGTYPNPSVVSFNGGTAFGTAAGVNTGTSGATIPLLNGNNTWGGTNAFGVETATSLALGGATIGTNALAVTGTSSLGGSVTLSSGNLFINSGNVAVISGVISFNNQSTLNVTSGTGTFVLTGPDGSTKSQITIGSVAGQFQFGAVNAAAPVAQTLQFQGANSSGTNGANATIIGSLAWGNAGGTNSGDIIFQTGVKQSAAQATATTALTIKGETQALVTAALDAASSTGGALQVAGGASVAKRFWLPAITASSGLQTAVLCQSSGGEVIADSVACLASSARFKDMMGKAESGALDKIIKVPIQKWKYRRESDSVFPENYYSEHIGPTAEDIEAIDSRLVGRDKEGKARSISTEQLLALAIQAIQEQQVQIDELKVLSA